MFHPGRKTNYNGITEGVIWKQMLLFFFPILFGTLFQQLYTTVDAIVVGQFVGKEALSAVGGSTSEINNLLLGFFVGVSAGANVIIAQRYGAKDYKSTMDAMHTAVALAVLCGILMTFLGLTFAGTVLTIMSTPEEIYPYALTYMRIYFCGMIFNVLYNIGSGILRALGDSKRPLYVLITCCVSNIVLDLLFVIVLGLGVAGAALATILAQTISGVLVLLALLGKRGPVRLYLHRLRIHFYICKPLIKIGIPTGLQSLMYSIPNLVIQASINKMGTDVVSALTAYAKADIIYWMIMQAFGITCMTFVGQNLGARRLDRVYKSVHTALLLSTLFTLCLCTVYYFNGPLLLGIFTTDPTVISIGYEMMQTIVPLYFTYILVEVMAGTMRGAGDTFVPMLFVCLGTCVVRILWVVYVVGAVPTYRMLCYSYPVSWLLTSILFLVYYKKRRWLKKALDM